MRDNRDHGGARAGVSVFLAACPGLCYITRMTSTNDRRLNKFIADSGYCSRRDADQLIADGRVRVDGRVAVMGERIAVGQRVTVDGHPLDGAGEKVYLAVYKPRGIVSTAEPREPRNIVSYIDYPVRVYPVGRLDKDSEGLILLTSDGDIVNGILRAAGRHEKEYEVTVDRPVTAQFLKRMREGVPILGRVTLPAQVRRTGPNAFTIILVQGLNRQIRRMCEALGYQVTYLRRVRIMHITLGGMQPGHWRELTDKERETLFDTLAAEKAGSSTVDDAEE